MAILFFFFGLFLGSFLLLAIDRIPKNETILYGHSHCDFCGHTLWAKDLIPVFSYVFLKGRCRYCHKKLSLSYPLIEALTGVLLAISVVFLPSLSLWQYIAVCGIVGSLIVIFFSDLFHGIIPDIALLTGLFFSLFFVGFNPSLFLSHFIVGLFGCLFFLIFFLGSKGKGMGFGDVKYGFFMGFLLGFPGVVTALYVAFLTGALVASILIIAKRKKLRGDTIAFGPFLVLGTFITLLWGNILWEVLSKVLLKL